MYDDDGLTYCTLANKILCQADFTSDIFIVSGAASQLDNYKGGRHIFIY